MDNAVFNIKRLYAHACIFHTVSFTHIPLTRSREYSGLFTDTTVTHWQDISYTPL